MFRHRVRRIDRSDVNLVAAFLLEEGYATDEFSALDHADVIVEPMRGTLKTVAQCRFMYRTARLVSQIANDE